MEQHTLHHEVLNVFEPGETGQHWDVEVHATPEELQAFAETGYLIRENLFQGAALHRTLEISTDFVNCPGNDRTACPSTRIERTNHLSRG